MRPSHSISARPRWPTRGTALLPAVLLVSMMMAMAAVLVMTGIGQSQDAMLRRDLVQARAAAEDGLAFAMASVEAGRHPTDGSPILVDYFFEGFAFQSRSEDPLGALSRHYVNVYAGDVDGLDNDGNGAIDDPEERAYLLVDSLGVAGAADRAVQGLRATVFQSILPFRNAIYAGNSSRTPGYVLPLGGNTSTNGDVVSGNVYSAGQATVSGAARVDGTVRAGLDATVASTATVTGDVVSNLYQPLVPLFQQSHFAPLPEYRQVTAASLAGDPIANQIFELNPVGSLTPSYDRLAQVQSTALNDFFLEEFMPGSTLPGGTSHTDLRLHASGNHRIYYVDGNIWLNSKRTYGFDIQALDGAPVKVTFVASGNIYLSDNLYYDNPNSLVSFIAIENPSLPASTRSTQSGNILVGDPIFGTLVDFSGLLYAQNDFIDNNLTASGSQSFTIRGAMTARDQVNIRRDYVDSRGRLQHSKMTVHHDRRIFDPSFQLSPGIDALVGPRSEGDALRVLAITPIGTPAFQARPEFVDLPAGREYGVTRGAD